MTDTLKTVLITGAGKRLGRAIALDLARHGWNIALHYNASEKEARATCEDARTAGVIMSTSPMLRSLKTARRRMFCNSIVGAKTAS